RFFVQSGNSAVCPLLPDAIQLRRSIPAPVKLTPSSSCRSGSRNSPSLAVAAASRKSRTDPMGGFPARLHLPFAQWPELDKVLWGTALAAADPFEPTTGGRLSAASRQRYFMGWRRFVGFLALCEPEALQLSPAERLCPDRIKGFAHHL